MRNGARFLIVLCLLAAPFLVFAEIQIPVDGGLPRQKPEPTHPETGISPDGERSNFLPRPLLLWKFKSKGPFSCAPCLIQGKVIIGDKDGILSCLSAENGRKQWSRRFSGYFAASAVVDEKNIYISLSRREVTYYREPGGGIFGSSPRTTRLVEEEGVVRCLNLFHGRRRWKRSFSQPVHSSPVLAGDRLLVGCLDHKIYCLDRATGSIIWEYKTGGPVDVSPAICDGRVLIGSRNGTLYCLDLKEGKQYWRFGLGNRVSAAPVCGAGKVYVGAGNQELYGINIKTGKAVWKSKISGSLSASPILYRGSIYAGTGAGKIYRIRAEDGKEQWSHKLTRRIYSSPELFADSLLVSSADGVIYCLDLKDGAVLWKYNLFSGTPAWFSLQGNRIFAACRDRKIYCLGEVIGSGKCLK